VGHFNMARINWDKEKKEVKKKGETKSGVEGKTR
jgi:hypothetical protein